MLRRIVTRALLVVAGVGLGILLLEAGLQAAALLRPGARLAAPSGGGDGQGLRILCVGDSCSASSPAAAPPRC
jgi:hypothetical protein